MYRIFICNLLWQLLLILYTLIINGYTHCDIHPKNIFVKVIDKSDTSYPNIRLHSNGPIYTISIIDFGETTNNNKRCTQLRKKSKILAEVGCNRWKKYTISKRIGANINALYHLPHWSKNKRQKSKFNSDIWFYFNLLKSLKMFSSKLIRTLRQFIESVDDTKGWSISSNNPISPKHNLVKLFKIIITLFKSTTSSYKKINILQLNKGNKVSNYSLMDNKLLNTLNH